MPRRIKDEDTINDIGALYCAGELSIRKIADQFEVTDGFVRKKAKQNGWVRDRAQVIRNQAKGKAQRAQAAASVILTRMQEGIVPLDKPLSEAEVLASVSDLQSHKIADHQERLTRLRDVGDGLTDELQELQNNIVPVHEAIQLLVSHTKSLPELGDLQKIANSITVGNRVRVFKELIGAITSLINAERKAFDMDDPDKAADPLADHLEALANDLSSYTPAETIELPEHTQTLSSTQE